MTFTDDDLKRLKNHVYDDSRTWMGSITISEIKALLARLEAAENVLKDLQPTPKNHANYVFGSTRLDLEAWRNAAGK